MDMIRSMILSIRDKDILLPNTAVAEIIPYTKTDDIEESSKWLMGLLDWRGKKVPIVSLESLNNDHEPWVERKSRVAVLNMIEPGEEYPFMGVVLQKFPKLSRVSANDVEDFTTLSGDIFTYEGSLRGQKVFLINIEAMQDLVLSELQRLKL